MGLSQPLDIFLLLIVYNYILELPMTHEEMVDAAIPIKHRNYCADKWMKWARCVREENFMGKTFLGHCDHPKHVYEDCMYDE